MLENQLKERKLGQKMVDLQPSSNRVFAPESRLERLFLSPYENLQFEESPSIPRKLGCYLLYGTYVGLELLSRNSETFFRGIGRGAKYVFGCRTEPKANPYSEATIKDYLVSGISSLAAVGILYFGIQGAISSTTPVPGSVPESRDRRELPVAVSPAVPIPAPEPALFFERHQEVYLPPSPQPGREAVTNFYVQHPLPLSQFQNDHVLIYCANAKEKNYVWETLQDNQDKKPGRHLKIDRKKNKASLVDLLGRKVEIDVVLRGQAIPPAAGGYDVINLRGHIQEMLPLYQEVQEYAADNSLSLLGGCRSAEFIPKMSSPNHPVIASRVRSYGPQNTYLLIQILEEMSTAPSWAELSSRIEQKSEKAREFVFPE